MHQLAEPAQEIQHLLQFVCQNDASDLHLKVGYAPHVRIGGKLRRLESVPLPDSAYVEGMMKLLIPPTRVHEYDEFGGLDFAVRLESGDRFRVNIFRSEGEMHAALCRVRSKIPDFETLNLPEVYRETIARNMVGLILVSGVTGSGKSSTLAAMLDYINNHRELHIITVEDPIEYSFQSNHSIISQREIGIDVPSFATALRYIVRQDPDCIMIGEMRDRDTMLAAIQAAETGHLVLGSIHSSNVQLTFSRILEFFRREEHTFIRSSLANSLIGILSQRLLPGVDEGAQYPATEVLLGNSLVKEKIVHEEDEDFPAILHTCREEGMRSYTQSLAELVNAQKISRETAMDYAPNREALTAMLKGISTAQSLVGRLRK